MANWLDWFYKDLSSFSFHDKDEGVKESKNVGQNIYLPVKLEQDSWGAALFAKTIRPFWPWEILLYFYSDTSDKHFLLCQISS